MGFAVGTALLVRPNLAPCAVVAGAWLLLEDAGRRTRVANAARMTAAAAPGIVVMLALNAALYGHPLRAGYGDPGNLFSVRHVGANLANYGTAVVQTAFAIPLMGVAAPVLLTGRHRRLALLGVGVAIATVAVYLFYRPFDEWWYLRFLLPAVVPLTALAVAAACRTIERTLERRMGPRVWVQAAFGVAMVAMASVQVASDRQAFDLDRLERRFWRTGDVVRGRLPANAVAIAVWQSGTVRFHAQRESIVWDSLDPAWLDRAVAWLSAHGYDPYFVMERWEEPLFRERFAAQSPLGALDWPPRFDVERQVRIYHPGDRQRYRNGEPLSTELVAER
jgi:hypothetical protein